MTIIKSMTDIVAMQEEVKLWVEEKGWNLDNRTFGDELMLIVSEAAEALEAYRQWGMEDRTHLQQTTTITDGKVVEDTGLIQKPEGVPSELADILVRLLDTCSRHDIDLGKEFRDKMDYNWTRTHRHGGKRL